ncbi:DUF5667 domain-containing protein [Terrabacter sp. MAHUQ-38]|uniref:DUF5667 domain-containing protein n=1 Tax=unclassified Terrabacter TaxID=2630222 RepID=UPI00165D7982|nr:DUF5667 domain-containing protein [Terrabacter sp. MAHUQ-38]MBC9822297.1 hypothetical protein [Terrabacter sp. MAHUQ-38]
MDLGANADGELLQRALDGERVTEPGILELVAVLHAVQAVDQAGLAPRAEFVSDLRARLLADGGTAVLPVTPVPPPAGTDGAQASPGTEPTSTSTGPSTGLSTGPSTPDERRLEDGKDGEGGTGGTVSVLRVAARPLRFLAAAAAGILVVGGSLGAASRTALPGDALYGVKQLLDRAAVQLAGSRLDEGLTYLAQAQEHIEDARDLLDRGDPSTHDLDTAYDAASDATRRAQTILLDVYTNEKRTEALTELADFYTRAIPQVEAMRPRVPAESLPAWQRLRDLLGAGQLATLRVLATCTGCGDRALQARQVLSTVTGAARPTTPGGSSPAPGTRSPTGTPTPSGSVPGLPLPSATVPHAQLPGVTVPGVTVPGVTATGGVTLPGGTVNLPSVGITSSSVGGGGGGVTLPGATVNLPSVGITSSTIGAGGGGVTLPGVTVTVPTIKLGAPTVPSASLPAPTKLLP